MTAQVVYSKTLRGLLAFAAHWLMWTIGKALYRPALSRRAVR